MDNVIEKDTKTLTPVTKLVFTVTVLREKPYGPVSSEEVNADLTHLASRFNLKDRPFISEFKYFAYII